MYVIGVKNFSDCALLTFSDVDGRFCAPIPQIQPGLVCCLPCPATDFLYPQSFKHWYRAAEALNLVGLVLLLFLLVSFICLPAEKTRRHYLSYCLIIAAILMAVCYWPSTFDFLC